MPLKLTARKFNPLNLDALENRIDETRQEIDTFDSQRTAKAEVKNRIPDDVENNFCIDHIELDERVLIGGFDNVHIYITEKVETSSRS